MTLHQAVKTSVSQASTRHGFRQVRSQVIEGLEDSDEADAAHAMDVDHDAKVEESEKTQSAKHGSLEQLVADTVSGQRKRHTKLREGAGKAYDNSYKKVQDSINVAFDDHERKAYSAHQAQLRRLQELLGQKAKIEIVMSERLASLRADYYAHSRDLEAVIDRRLKELK
ncbi:Nn.00g100870.m01.CDS01 [Neocucurbitaria sp. VM-36]